MEVPYCEGECIKRRDYNGKKVSKKYSKKAIQQQKLLNLIDGRVAAEASLKYGLTAKCITINYYGNQLKSGSYALVYANKRRCRVELTPEMVAKPDVIKLPKVAKEVKKKNRGVTKGISRGQYKERSL
jgi:hypothetical protein